MHERVGIQMIPNRLPHLREIAEVRAVLLLLLGLGQGDCLTAIVIGCVRLLRKREGRFGGRTCGPRGVHVEERCRDVVEGNNFHVLQIIVLNEVHHISIAPIEF